MKGREDGSKMGASLRAILKSARRTIACKQAPTWRILGVGLCFGAATMRAETVIDFENAEIGQRPTEWVEQGVMFTLAHAPTKTKAAGRMVFFPHIETGHKGILCAMATEPIPVEARFPSPVAAVTVVFWASTGCAARLEAFDEQGELVDQASLAEAPRRKEPGEPVPFFELKVRAPKIAFVRFSGPRAGEFLAADEVRFEPAK